MTKFRTSLEHGDIIKKTKSDLINNINPGSIRVNPVEQKAFLELWNMILIVRNSKLPFNPLNFV